jgi:MFS family permease
MCGSSSSADPGSRPEAIVVLPAGDGAAACPARETLYTKPFLLASAANALFYANINAFNLLPLYIGQLGGRESDIGTIMAMYQVAAIICQAGAGPLIDRFGRRPFLLLSAGLISAVSLAFMGTTRLGWHFYFLRFLQGAAVASFNTSNLTLLADLAPPGRRAEAVGIFGVSGLVMIALAPAGGEVVLRHFGFPVLFAVTLALALATLGVCLAGEVPREALPETARRLGRSFWRKFSPVLVPAFQFGLANAVVFVFLPPFAHSVGLPRVGPFYLVYSLMAVAVRFFGGRLADRLERRQVILPALVGLALGVLALSLLESTWLLIVVGIVNGTAHGFLFPAASALAFDLAPAAARGKALAIFNAAILAGGIVGAIGFGWIAELVGYRPGFLCLGLALGVGAAVFWRKR